MTRVSAKLGAVLAPDANLTVITSGNRLARACREAVADIAMQQGLRAWPEPTILPWESWLRAAHAQWPLNQPDAPPMVLSATQAQSVWTDACQLEIKRRGIAFQGVTMLAQQCQRAHGLLQEWQLPDDAIDQYPGNEDTAFFREVLQRYRRRQAQEGWISASELGAWWLQTQAQRASNGRTVFAGFLRLTPVQTQIAQHVSAQVIDAAATAPESIQRRRYPGPDDELIAAGAWARDQLIVAPNKKLAIIVPDLSSRRAICLRRISEGLQPNTGGDAQRTQIDVTVAPSLHDYPGVSAMLAWAFFAIEEATFVTLSRLLRSPVLNTNERVRERALRAEVALRDIPEQRWHCERLSAWLEAKSLSVEWIAPLLKLAAARTQHNTPSVWAQHLGDALEAIGVLRAFQDTSIGFQLANAVRQTLNQLSALNAVTGPMPLCDALRHWRRIILATTHQAESRHTNVLLAGPLELPGMRFDAVWLANADAGRWPPPGAANAMLPFALQRTYQMPDADVTQTRDFWQSAQSALFASASQIIVSDSLRDGDIDLLPSSLTPDVALLTGEAQRRGHSGLIGTAQLRDEVDAIGAFCASRRARGGWRTLHRQMTLPFAAMVHGRWAPRELRVPEVGLNALERGNLLHEAMHKLYAPLLNQPMGKAGVAPETDAIRTAVADAMRRLFVNADASTQSLLRLEEHRAVRAISRFVSEEANRPAFCVEALEYEERGHFGGLTLSLRIDRRDSIAGIDVIIDYKTGAPKPVAKLNTSHLRGDAMQLGCYLVSATASIGAVALGYVTTKVNATNALHSDAIAPISPYGTCLSQDAMRQEQQALAALFTQLGEAFVAGDCRINLDAKIRQDDWRPTALISRYVEYRG
ncbi:MAG: PD-(D/E)XK nuclease family protein [Pseudomonadota bacterium]